MSKAALPFLEASSSPAIINQTSVAAYGVDEWLDYGTARARHRSHQVDGPGTGEKANPK